MASTSSFPSIPLTEAEVALGPLVTKIREMILRKVEKNEMKPEVKKYADEWADDACIRRYLRAHRSNLDKALAGLICTIEWRISFGLDDLDAKDLAEVMSVPTFFLSSGSDKVGRPIIMAVKPDGKENDDYEKELKKVAYTLEKAACSMQPGNEKWIWIMDLKHFSYFNGTPLSVAKQVAQIFANHYPERLYRSYLVDAPWAFRVLWTMLTPFLDSVTLAKFQFIQDRDSKGFKNIISDLISTDQLEPVLGGTHEPYSYAKNEKTGPLKKVFADMKNAIYSEYFSKHETFERKVSADPAPLLLDARALVNESINDDILGYGEEREYSTSQAPTPAPRNPVTPGSKLSRKSIMSPQ